MLFEICILARMMVHKSSLHLKSLPSFCTYPPVCLSIVHLSVSPSIHYICSRWLGIGVNSISRERQFWTDKEDAVGQILDSVSSFGSWRWLALHRGKSAETGWPLGRFICHGSSPAFFFPSLILPGRVKRAGGSLSPLSRGQSVGTHTLPWGKSDRDC